MRQTTGIMAALAMAALVVPLAGQRTPDNAAGEVAVGVLIGDEFIVPVGAYRDGAWHALSEPHSGGRLDGVLSAEGNALAHDRWTRLDPDGRTTPFALRAPTAGGFHCAGVEGYRTTLPSAGGGPDTPVGFAVAARGASLVAVQDVRAQPDGESRRSVRLVTQVVQAMEADRADAGDALLGRIPASTRSSTTVRLPGLWRSGDADERTYYFEARKHYPAPGVQVYVSGWIHRRAGDLRLSTVRAVVARTEGEGSVATAQVLGVVRLQSPIWVLRERYYEGEAYVLHESGPAGRGRMVKVSGGGC